MSGRLARRKVDSAGAPNGAALQALAEPPELEPQSEKPADQTGLIIYRGPDWEVQGHRWEAHPDQLLEYQQLWLTLETGWSTLAVLGTASRISEQEVGLCLASVGSDAGHQPIAFMDATGVRMSQTNRFIERLRVLRHNGARIIVVLEPLADNPAGFALAEAVDERVLVVRPGLSTFAAIDRTVELVGGATNIRGIISRSAESKRDG